MSRNSEGQGVVFRALAHQSRSRILNYLKDKDYVRAGRIAEALDIGNSTLSAHLRILREANLVTSREVGTEVQYRANLSTLEDLIVSLRSWIDD